MLIAIQLHWVQRPPTGIGGATWDGTGKAFDTATHTIKPYATIYVQGITDPIPYDIPLPAVGDLMHFECGPAPDFDKTNWFYGANDTVTSTIEPNAAICGWTPPPPPPLTCNLQLVLTIKNGDTIECTPSGAHGAVTYSRDGGLTRQTGNSFGPLVGGTYTITAYDAGSAGCQATQTVTLSPAVPLLVPGAASLPAVGFSRNPLPLVVQANAPGRALLLELWVEQVHGTGLYDRISQRLRPTDAQGRAVFQLQDQLHAQLDLEPLDLGAPLSLRRLRHRIRRYYASLAEVLPATGVPGPANKLPPATVLRGGLGWAPARAGTFFAPLPPDFLTWRPAGEQRIGRAHVVLLAALVPAPEQSATLRVQVYRRGAAQPFATLTDVLPLPGLIFNQVASPNLVQVQVPVAALPPDTYRLEVALVVAGQVQASRRYLLDDGYRHRQYVFLNSLGQWDTLSCTGPLTSKASVERTVATHLLAPDYDPQDGPESVVGVALDARLSVSTGPIAPAEVEYLRELLLSGDVYEVAGAQLRKIRLTTKDFIDAQDDAGADGVAFEYAYCYDSTLYDPARITRF